MSNEHRKPLVAFVLLALAAAVLVGIGRADAQAGRVFDSLAAQATPTLPAGPAAQVRQVTVQAERRGDTVSRDEERRALHPSSVEARPRDGRGSGRIARLHQDNVSSDRREARDRRCGRHGHLARRLGKRAHSSSEVREEQRDQRKRQGTDGRTRWKATR